MAKQLNKELVFEQWARFSGVKQASKYLHIDESYDFYKDEESDMLMESDFIVLKESKQTKDNVVLVGSGSNNSESETLEEESYGSRGRDRNEKYFKSSTDMPDMEAFRIEFGDEDDDDEDSDFSTPDATLQSSEDWGV